MISIDWNPMPYLGPVPINWYGITFAIAIFTARFLVIRWAPNYGLSKDSIDRLLVWILVGVVAGARLYYVVQNDFPSYLTHPWRILAIWEGGLAFFGGLIGGIGAAYLCCRRDGFDFARTGDLFAPAIPIAGAIGRISCGLDGMDYGTPTELPWGVVYRNPNSYAPLDGLPRHPDQYYELVGDLIIAAILLRLRGKMRPGSLLLLYLIAFSVLRFFVFFLRGNVEPVGLGLKNGQWTALVILVASVVMTLWRHGSQEQKA